MSDTEIIVPPPNEFRISDRGLIKWRPVLDSVSVTILPGNGRLLTVTGGDDQEVRHALTADEAAHLAKLLTSRSEPS